MYRDIPQLIIDKNRDILCIDLLRNRYQPSIFVKIFEVALLSRLVEDD